LRYCFWPVFWTTQMNNFLPIVSHGRQIIFRELLLPEFPVYNRSGIWDIRSTDGLMELWKNRKRRDCINSEGNECVETLKNMNMLSLYFDWKPKSETLTNEEKGESSSVIQSDSKLLSGVQFINYGNPNNNLESLCTNMATFLTLITGMESIYRVWGWKVGKIKKIISLKLIVILVSGLCHRKGKLWKFSFSCPGSAHAPPHICHHVRNHLEREVFGRWIGRDGPIA
jgi:hypothetical protein